MKTIDQNFFQKLAYLSVLISMLVWLSLIWNAGYLIPVVNFLGIALAMLSLIDKDNPIYGKEIKGMAIWGIILNVLDALIIIASVFYIYSQMYGL